MGNYTVYKHTSPNGKIYIGITKQELSKRWENGRGYKRCPRFYPAIKKHGWDSFEHTVLQEGLTKEEAEAEEIRLIALHKSNRAEYGYNVENGGNCSGTHSAETRRKISEANKGRKFSEETIEKMRKAHKGRQTGEENPFYGRRHTEEIKKAQSDFMKGNSYFKGHRHSTEFKVMKSGQMHAKYKDGGNPRCKKVVQKDENGNVVRTFYSLREVSRVYNVSASTVYKWIHRAENKEWSYEEGFDSKMLQCIT